MKFTDLPLHADVMKGIDAANFVTCMPVQERVYPHVLDGQDVMVQSKTGSGKTAVFLVAVLQKYVVARERLANAAAENSSGSRLPVALIVAPTRELAVQIEDDARILSAGIPGYRIGCFYGGVGYVRQDKQIVEGVDLLIGTPGRLLDYQHTGKIDFKCIDTFIIDEADRLFDMGFYPDVQKMFSMMVAKEKRQTMLFSATLGTRVRNLAWEYMNSPKEIEVQPEEITVKAITQELYHVAKDEKFMLFLRLLARENPTNALIFTNTKAKAVELSKRLAVNGYQVQYLMGDLPQSKRLQVINRMKQGDLKFLVATDVAARGLQIDDLELVFNYDIPEDFESYVHRIGRTARAGKSGKAITLACEQFVYGLEAIETFIQMKIPVMWIQEGDLPVVVDKSAGMRFRDLVDESEYASAPGGQRNRSGSRSAYGKAPASRGRDAGSARSRTGSAVAAKRVHKPGSVETPVRKDHTIKPRSAPSVAVGKEVRHKVQRQEKSYADIQSMDFEERIAYYKQLYGTESSDGVGQAAEKIRANEGRENPSSDQRKRNKPVQGRPQEQKSPVPGPSVPRQGSAPKQGSVPRTVASPDSRNASNNSRSSTNGPVQNSRQPRPAPSQGNRRAVPDVPRVADASPVSGSTLQSGSMDAGAKKLGLLSRLLRRIKGDA